MTVFAFVDCAQAELVATQRKMAIGAVRIMDCLPVWRDCRDQATPARPESARGPEHVLSDRHSSISGRSQAIAVCRSDRTARRQNAQPADSAVSPIAS